MAVEVKVGNTTYDAVPTGNGAYFPPTQRNLQNQEQCVRDACDAWDKCSTPMKVCSIFSAFAGICALTAISHGSSCETSCKVWAILGAASGLICTISRCIDLCCK